MIERLRSWWSSRRAALALEGLSEHVLRDIGVMPDEVLTAKRIRTTFVLAPDLLWDLRDPQATPAPEAAPTPPTSGRTQPAARLRFRPA